MTKRKWIIAPDALVGSGYNKRSNAIVHRLVNAGKLESVKIGGNLFIDRAEFEEATGRSISGIPEIAHDIDNLCSAEQKAKLLDVSRTLLYSRDLPRVQVGFTGNGKFLFKRNDDDSDGNASNGNGDNDYSSGGDSR